MEHIEIPIDQFFVVLSLAPEECTRRAPRPDMKKFTAARDETAALTAQIQAVEREIDSRVTALCGL